MILPIVATQVIAYGIQIDLGISQLQILEKNPIQVVIIVLPRMSQNHIKIFPTFIDNHRQTDNLRTRPYNNEQLELAVIL